uniref:C2H2-type domain-containing protein n=1 Tax=Panagrolaimus superbus TaxID=310955 RepID=A0A914YVR2_9BILA
MSTAGELDHLQEENDNTQQLHEHTDDDSLLQQQQQQYDEDGVVVDEHNKDQQLVDDEYNGQDMIGQVIQGEDGELYLLAAADDDTNNAQHEGIMDMNSVQEVKIMVDSETSQMVYYNGDKEEDGSQEPGSSVSGRALSFMAPKNVYPQGMKGRRNRIFGNFSCPLCAKTYKYEYNLFYHWRKTCRDLDDVFSVNERKNLDVNTLRTAVDDLVRKREHYGHISMGISPQQLFRSSHYDKLVLPVRRNLPCKACGVAIPQDMKMLMNLMVVHSFVICVD